MRISDWSSDVCSSDLVASKRSKFLSIPPPLPCALPNCLSPQGTSVLLVHESDWPARRRVRSARAAFLRQQGGEPGVAVGDAGEGQLPRDVRKVRRCKPPVQRAQYVLLGSRGLASECRLRSEEHTSELQSLMRTSYAVFCLKKKKQI